MRHVHLRRLTIAAMLCVGLSFPAAAQELVVGSFGGSFAENVKACHVTAFEKATGATVSLKLGNSSQFAAAIRATGGKPDMDVVFIDNSLAAQVHGEKLSEALDRRKLTNATDVMQAGVSSGRTSTDNCEIVRQLPEVITTDTTALPTDYCHLDSPFLTQAKAMVSSPIPDVDVQVAAAFQSNPGPVVQATFIAPNALAAQSLGRPLSGGAGNVQVNLLKANALAETPGVATAGVMYGDRVNQVDLRIGKVLRFAQRRTTVNLDLYNVLNSNAVLIESTAYRTFRTPQFVMTPRFIKISAQLDF